MPEADLPRRDLAMSILPVQLSGPCSPGLPHLRRDAPHGALLRVRPDDLVAQAMRLTPRCTDLLRLLRTARWLSTSQVHRRFFPKATLDAARKRLRKLAAKRYVVGVRKERLGELLFTLGSAGKRALERESAGPVTLERRPPLQIEHMLGINELRIAAELAEGVGYFFAAWELPALGWKQDVIPDAILEFRGGTFALEFDRGGEGIRVFQAKIAAYRRGFEGFPIAAVLVVTERLTRMEALARAIRDAGERVLFATLAQIHANGLAALALARNRIVSDPASLLWVSSRQESSVAATSEKSDTCGCEGGASSGERCQ
jgi:Replication-relaxation